MELKTFERLILLNILPKEGDITTLRIVRKLRDDLSFSEEEHAALQFRNEPEGRILWLEEKDVPKEVAIGEKAHDIIAATLKKLNEQKKLQDAHIPLYERFVEAKA